MIRSIFFIFLSMLGTIVFFAFFMFIFANSVHMRCDKQENKAFTCLIEKKLFDQVVISKRTVKDVTSATVVKNCDSDGCSYRVELFDRNGIGEPFDEVYTDAAPMKVLAEKINTSIGNSDGPSFSVKSDLQWWLVIMLGGMTLIGLLVEVILIFRAGYKGWMTRQWF